MSTAARRFVLRDALNRAWRSFLQGLVLDVVAAVALVVYDSLGEDKPDYRLMYALALKTALQSAAAYVMRRKLDHSVVPTPLPPSPPATVVVAPGDLDMAPLPEGG